MEFAMQRRHFITAATASAAIGSSLTQPAQAGPARAADFAANVASQPLLAPFKGVDDLSGNRDSGPLLLRGRWPAEVRGRFYRNGPALMERGAERYHHWFDGDGMVQQFTLDGTRISHRGRLVRTTKLAAEQRAGRFLMSTLGTAIEGGPTGTGPDAFNVANTNAIEHAGRVLALWEGGSAYAMDPKDLATLGPVTWRADMAQVPFSAHPKVDAAGNLWNFGTSGRHIVAWHIKPGGELGGVQIGESPYPGGMAHDMAVTERYLVVPLPPVSLDFARPVAEGGPRRFALKPGEPLRVLVMEKADIRRRRVFELPPQMVFHVGNAHELPGGSISLSYVAAPDAWFLDQGAVALMAGRPQTAGRVGLQMATLDMASGRAQVDAVPGEVEFPRIDPRRIGLSGTDRARWLLSGVSWQTWPGRNNALLHGVQMLDTTTGRMKRHDYGEHVVAEEHIVVPKPGRSGELDAWLLGTTYDARRQATVLNLLDAAHVEDGPIAQAVLPYMLPLGFHGNFTAA
jgi:all-trans-8'-apo-beta-carotenal 15,15'-oxygenase